MNKLYAILLLMICLVSVRQHAEAQVRNGSLKGTVTTSDNKPAAMVSVALKGTSKGTMTDDAGRFEIKNVKPGSYTLTVSYVGLKTENGSCYRWKCNTVRFYDFRKCIGTKGSGGYQYANY
jgi:iron complex outermembrane receptor protein